MYFEGLPISGCIEHKRVQYILCLCVCAFVRVVNDANKIVCHCMIKRGEEKKTFLFSMLTSHHNLSYCQLYHHSIIFTIRYLLWCIFYLCQFISDIILPFQRRFWIVKTAPPPPESLDPFCQLIRFAIQINLNSAAKMEFQNGRQNII